MDAILEYILKFLLPSLIVGGGLWKGADTIVNALSKRAEAEMAQKRLDFEQMQANYDNAMDLLEKQSKRIDTLTNKVERYEIRIDALNERLDDQRKAQDDKEMVYTEEIRVLKIEIENLRNENKRLELELHQTQCDYQAALGRIEALEKGDTGPLRE